APADRPAPTRPASSDETTTAAPSSPAAPGSTPRRSVHPSPSRPSASLLSPPGQRRAAACPPAATDPGSREYPPGSLAGPLERLVLADPGQHVLFPLGELRMVLVSVQPGPAVVDPGHQLANLPLQR